MRSDLSMLRASAVALALAVWPMAAHAAPLCPDDVPPVGAPKGFDWGLYRETLKKSADEQVAQADEWLKAPPGKRLGAGPAGPAVSLLCKAAKDGHPEAMYILGQVADIGVVGPPDDTEGFRWYLAAAEKGHAKAMAFVGFAYASGDSQPVDLPEAFRWFQRAADLGNPWGLLNLGDMYDDGVVVPRDRDKAVRLWREAVARGGPSFQASLERKGRTGPDWAQLERGAIQR